MLKFPITYRDFNDEMHTEDFYFNLSESELMELEVSVDGGFTKMLEKIIAAEDNRSVLAEFKKIILAAHGVKSEDGKRFIKTEQLREEFSQHAAYPALFMQLSSDADVAAEFVNGLIPKDLAKKIEEKELADKMKEKTSSAPSTAEIAAQQAKSESLTLPPQAT